jgi:hypothetical protein
MMLILSFICVLGATHVLIILVSRWSWCSSFLLSVLLVCWSSWSTNDHDVHLFFLLVFLVQIMCCLSWSVGYHDVHPFFFWCYWCKSCVDHPNQLMIMMFMFLLFVFLVWIVCWSCWSIGDHDVHPLFSWCCWCSLCFDCLGLNQLLIKMPILSSLVLLMQFMCRLSWLASDCDVHTLFSWCSWSISDHDV